MEREQRLDRPELEKEEVVELTKDLTLLRLAEWIAIEHNETRLQADKYTEEAQGLADLLYIIGYRLIGVDALLPSEKEIIARLRQQGWRSEEEVKELIQDEHNQHTDTEKEIREQERERIITKLDKCFKLAPYDNDYLRLLVEDVVGELKTGKNAKQRQDEKWQALHGS